MSPLETLNRAEGIKSTLSESETTRLSTYTQSLELALAREFGHRLHPMAVRTLLSELILRPDFMAAVMTGTTIELPDTVEEWGIVAREVVQSDALARGSVEHSDMALKATIRQELLDKMRLEDKMHMGREGTLDDFIEEKVQVKLHDRIGL